LPESVDNKILSDAEPAQQLDVQTSSTIAIMATAKNQQTCYRETLAAGVEIVVMALEPAYRRSR
jgi:hypothetical protein